MGAREGRRQALALFLGSAGTALLDCARACLLGGTSTAFFRSAGPAFLAAASARGHVAAATAARTSAACERGGSDDGGSEGAGQFGSEVSHAGLHWIQGLGRDGHRRDNVWSARFHWLFKVDQFFVAWVMCPGMSSCQRVCTAGLRFR